jgi:hypothetical protein
MDPVDRILRGELPELECQNSVMFTLKTTELNSIIHEDYPHAKKVRRAQLILETRPLQPRVADERQINGNVRLARAKLSYQDKEVMWKDRLLEQENRSRENMANLRAVQDQEISDFEEYWRTDSNATVPFAKASPKLLQLRWSQKINAVAREFDMAAILRREGDERQLSEERVAEERAAATMRIAWEKLIAKHQRQVEVMTQNADHHRTDLELARAKDLADAELLIRNIENEHGDPYLARAKTETLHRDILASRAEQSQPVSPRTRAKFAHFKVAMEHHHLRVDGGSVADFMYKVRVPIHFIPGKT